MRVEYEQSVFEKIQDARLEAIKNNKKIEKLWLNEKEWKEFCTFILKTLETAYDTDGRWLDEKLRNMNNDYMYNGIVVGKEK